MVLGLLVEGNSHLPTIIPMLELGLGTLPRAVRQKSWSRSKHGGGEGVPTL